MKIILKCMELPQIQSKTLITCMIKRIKREEEVMLDRWKVHIQWYPEDQGTQVILEGEEEVVCFKIQLSLAVQLWNGHSKIIQTQRHLDVVCFHSTS